MTATPLGDYPLNEPIPAADGPQGPPGPPGDPGEVGPQGIQGPPGPGASVIKLAADFVNATITAQSVTGLGIPLAANAVVFFEFLLVVFAAAATTGIQVALLGPAGATFTGRISIPTSATADGIRYVNTNDEFNAPTASAGLTRVCAHVIGAIQNGATAGTLVPRVRSEVVGSAVTVRAGSVARWA